MKSQILAAISKADLPPALPLNAAIAANDRLRYVFSLLRVAMGSAQWPTQRAPTLTREQISCGIDNPALDNAISASRIVGKQFYIPGAKRLMVWIAVEVRVMAAPVVALKRETWTMRIDDLLGTLPAAADDLLDLELLASMISSSHDGPDSVCMLAMDLHKTLIALQTDIATELLDGAAVYNLEEADRLLVANFMAGVNRTANLEVNYPGLVTTATRISNRLLIQNDLGTTDAHVIVIHVQGLTVSVMCTDVREERFALLQEMLNPQGMTWEAGRTGQAAPGLTYYMVTGKLETPTYDACCAFLEFLGSRLFSRL